MRDGWITNAGTVVLGVCAVAVTGMLVRREFASTAKPIHQVVANWQEFAAAGHRDGGSAAPVTVVVFSDYQCPACRMLAASLDTIRSEQPNRLAVVYRHFPLPMHRYARDAARASECADRQARFAPYHRALFAEQDALNDSAWTRVAQRAGLPDTLAFRTCLHDSAATAAVDRDFEAGRRLNVGGTPTLLINGLRLDGMPRPDVLRAYITNAARTGAN